MRRTPERTATRAPTPWPTPLERSEGWMRRTWKLWASASSRRSRAWPPGPTRERGTVFQIATHGSVVDLQTLYEWCRIARRILRGPHTVGRVIARPFGGEPGSFVRSPERRDFAVPPPGPTVLDRLQEGGVPVYGVGKIQDIFSGQGITEGRYSDSNDHGIDLTIDYARRPGPSLVFANLVDFDSKYGHRNDPKGYATSIESLDRRLPELIAALAGGVLIMTGDHRGDPTIPTTDHYPEGTPPAPGG